MPRKFGVEIEFVGSIPDVAAALRNAGLNVENRAHTHLGSHDRFWTVKRDGSVQRGGELVSPPLDFDNPAHREQVNQAVLCLQNSGCRPHTSAGIHVHVEATHSDGRAMTGKEIAAVVRFTYKFEDAIYRIASSGWRTIRPGALATYAKPIPEVTARAIMECQTRDEVGRVWNGYTARQTRRGAGSRRLSSYLERYVATNLRSLDVHNTIEFRYFNSSVNPERIQCYIALCMAIMQDARNGYSRSVKKSYRLGAMARGEVTEQALFLRLQQILRSNSRDTQVCMSEDDWKTLRRVCWKGSVAQRPLSE